MLADRFKKQQASAAPPVVEYQLWAWGLGTSGQLGDNTAVTKSSPIQIGTLTDWMQFAAGSIHTISVKTDGTLWAWGPGGSGRLGLNDITNRSSPVQVGTLTNWAAVSAGGTHTMALRT